jgi:hypothetical protein
MIPRNNKIIPIATNVSCNSTELIFITYSFKINKIVIKRFRKEDWKKTLLRDQFIWTGLIQI